MSARLSGRAPRAETPTPRPPARAGAKRSRLTLAGSSRSLPQAADRKTCPFGQRIPFGGAAEGVKGWVLPVLARSPCGGCGLRAGPVPVLADRP